MGKRELTRNEQVVLVEASILAGMDWFEINDEGTAIIDLEEQGIEIPLEAGLRLMSDGLDIEALDFDEDKVKVLEGCFRRFGIYGKEEQD